MRQKYTESLFINIYYTNRFGCELNNLLYLRCKIIKVMTNIDNMNNELAALAAMSEAEACKLYNVDYKDEAIQYIVDYWTCIA